MKRAQDYVAKKAREALEASDGNRQEAALLLRVWADGDEALFRALAAPLMSNLTALAIQRVVAADRPGSAAGRAARAAKPRIAEAEILAALGSNRGQSMTSSRTAPPPPQGSARHKQAVSILAAAYRRKPGS